MFSQALEFSFFVLIIVCFIECFPNYIQGRRFNYDAEKNKLLKLSNITDLYYDQRLDNFNKTLTITWKQRYWINEKFFNGTGPIFLMIGGENDANPIWMIGGTWYTLAKKYVII